MMINNQNGRIFAYLYQNYFYNLNVNSQYLLTYFQEVSVNITLEENMFFNNTIYFYDGGILHGDNADEVNLNFTRLIVKNNFGIVLES